MKIAQQESRLNVPDSAATASDKQIVSHEDRLIRPSSSSARRRSGPTQIGSDTDRVRHDQIRIAEPHKVDHP